MGSGAWGRNPVGEVANGSGKLFEVLGRGHLVGEDRGNVVQFSAEFPFSLARVASWVDTVSSWLLMATIPETVAHRMDRVDLSPAVMVWWACGVRLGTRVGSSWRLSLTSEKVSAKKARGGGSLHRRGRGRVA